MITTLLTNLALVLVLALCVLVLGRFVRRPALLHGLWLVVLLRLFVPPLFEVGLLPGDYLPDYFSGERSRLLPVSEPLGEDIGSLEQANLGRVQPASQRGAALWKPSLPQIALGIWGLGSVVLLLMLGTRARRFRRVVALSEPAGFAIQNRTSELAKRINLEHAPAVRVVAGHFPPLVWTWAGQQKLILPGELIGRLQSRELDTLLLHELAHIRRKDHLVRLVELLSGVVFWWYPVVWWVHRRLRHYEELSCDAWVVQMLPNARKAYADALVKSLEMMNGHTPSVPSFACGIGPTKPIEERLTMIMRNQSSNSWSGRQKWFLALLAVSCLTFFPAWVEPGQGQQTGSDPTRQELRQIEEQSKALKNQLRELDRRHEELRWQQEREKTVGQIEALRQEADRLRAAGNSRDAEWAENQAEYLRQRIDLRQELMDSQSAAAEQREVLLVELKELSMQMEKLASEDRREGAEAQLRQLKERRSAAAEELKRLESGSVDLRRQIEELELRAAEQKIERLRFLGQDKEAEAIRRELEARHRQEDFQTRPIRWWRSNGKSEDREAEYQARNLHSFQKELEEMRQHYEQLLSEGHEKEAQQLMLKMELRKSAYGQFLQQQESDGKLRRVKEVPQED